MQQKNELKNEYLYADKTQQLLRANGFMVLANTMYYIYMAFLLLISVVVGERSLGFCGFIGILVGISLLAMWAIYLRNRKTRKMKYIILIGLCLVSWIMTYAYTQDFAALTGAFVLVCGILYYERKYILIAGSAYVLTIASSLATKFSQGANVGGRNVLDYVFVVSAVVMLIVIIYLTTNVAKVFNEHSVGAAAAEQIRQKEILEDVLMVADEVRKGTENAMGIIGELNESSDVVNMVVKDIADSNYSTSENIQTQTAMTQNIQESIKITIDSSEKMVAVARKSNEINQQNVALMEDLKQQSRMIGKTNEQVSDAMRLLQEKTNAVKGITSTIFAISNQTNMLALNASIESARAGAAGRGFAVVADEIRQLAAKTKEETEHIGHILDELSGNAQEAVSAVGSSVEAAGVQEQMIEQVSESFDNLSGNVNELITEIENIDQLLINLSEANNQIVDNISDLSATTEEVTASSLQATEMTMDNLTQAEIAKEELTNVLTVSRRLEKYM